MRAICLCAGQSSRLMPLTRDVHKSALLVSGWPILDWQLTAFLHAEIRQVTIVSGHGSHETHRLLERWKPLLDLNIVKNEEFYRKNLDFSLLCAAKFLQERILYFEGDLLLPPELLRRFVQSRAEITVAASRTPRAQQVDALLRRKGLRIFLECKEHGSLDIHGSEGEFICAVGFGSRSASSLRDQLGANDFEGSMQLYSIFSRLMATEQTSLLDGSHYPWIEIDTEKDLLRAAEVVAAFGFQPPIPKPV
jgi:choline kinase